MSLSYKNTLKKERNRYKNRNLFPARSMQMLKYLEYNNGTGYSTNVFKCATSFPTSTSRSIWRARRGTWFSSKRMSDNILRTSNVEVNSCLKRLPNSLLSFMNYKSSNVEHSSRIISSLMN